MSHDPFASAAVLARICDGLFCEGATPALSRLASDMKCTLAEVYWACEVLERRTLLCRTPDGSAFPWHPTDDGWRAAGYEPPILCPFQPICVFPEAP